MMQARLIVLEGIDGSGKSTQFRLLWQSLEREGRSLRRIVFPRYDQESSALVRLYLGGAFGARPGDVNAYAASTFYAVDRYAAFKSDWGADYRAGKLILSDRYTTSNACHQGAKLSGAARRDYLDWLYDFEFRLLELPRPDLVLYLDVSLEAALGQIAGRQARTGEQGDIHEKDREYLGACLEAGRYAADHYGWQRIPCLDGAGHMRPPEDIHEDIRAYVAPLV